MKEAACAIKLNTHFSVSLVTTILLFLTRLNSPSTMVLGAPSNRGLGSSTDYQFSYNITDVFVDRVCRRVPVLLDPSVKPLCRIVDVNCIVEDPCVHPDPVERLLRTAPCPPVWKPALVCSTSTGSKLDCAEKLSIFRKCFLSPNRPVYDLTTRKESCKLKSACGLWFKTCSEEFSLLSDVFVNCSATNDNGISAHVPTNMPATTYTMHHVVHTTLDVDNATHPTDDVLRTANMVPNGEAGAKVTWIIVAVALSLFLMFSVIIFCSVYQHKKWTSKRSNNSPESEHGNGSTESLEVKSDRPFLKNTDRHIGSNLEDEEKRELLVSWNSNETDSSDPSQRIGYPLITISNVSGLEIGTENKERDCVPPCPSTDDDREDKSLLFDTGLEETNLETHVTLVLPSKSNTPTSKSDCKENTQCPVDDSGKSVMPESNAATSTENLVSNVEGSGAPEPKDDSKENTQFPVDDSEDIVMPESNVATSTENLVSNVEGSGAPEPKDDSKENTQCAVDDSEDILMSDSHAMSSLENLVSNVEENGIPKSKDNIQENTQCPVDGLKDIVMLESCVPSSPEAKDSNGERNGVPEAKDDSKENAQCAVDDSEDILMSESHRLLSPEAKDSNVERSGAPEPKDDSKENTQCAVDDSEDIVMSENYEPASAEASDSNGAGKGVPEPTDDSKENTRCSDDDLKTNAIPDIAPLPLGRLPVDFYG